MNKQPLYIIGMITIATMAISLFSIGTLFAGQAENISITVILNTDPEILDIQPPDGSAGYPENIIVISVNAEDKEGNALQYQFLIDGQIMRAWSEEPTYSWNVTSGDVGLHTIKAEVTDGVGETVSHSAEVYIFIKPITPPGD